MQIRAVCDAIIESYNYRNHRDQKWQNQLKFYSFSWNIRLNKNRINASLNSKLKKYIEPIYVNMIVNYYVAFYKIVSIH